MILIVKFFLRDWSLLMPETGGGRDLNENFQAHNIGSLNQF